MENQEKRQETATEISRILEDLALHGHKIARGSDVLFDLRTNFRLLSDQEFQLVCIYLYQYRVIDLIDGLQGGIKLTGNIAQLDDPRYFRE